jgi:epoxyqueuosine reductase
MNDIKKLKINEKKNFQDKKTHNTMKLKSFITNLGIDLVGVADLQQLIGMPMGVPSVSKNFMKRYQYAIILGMQLNKLVHKAQGRQVSLFLEKTAFKVMGYLEEKGHRSLIIHTDEEFDPVARMGFMSLKVLAKEAGLGWQGRSLLIISPDYGPLHRLVAVLTDMPLEADKPIPNQCGDCSSCVDECPVGALTFTNFDDHPEHREDVLDIGVCLGDSSCMACIEACPWLKRNSPVTAFDFPLQGLD